MQVNQLFVQCNKLAAGSKIEQSTVFLKIGQIFIFTILLLANAAGNI